MLGNIFDYDPCPSIEDTCVRRLLSKLQIDSAPIVVAIRPESYGRINECFDTVQEKMRRDGGSMVIGWTLLKGVYIAEAEFHVNWSSGSGDIVDVTPKPYTSSTSLFIPDNRMECTGRQVDNVRMNLTDNGLVDDLILASELEFKLLNKGKRATQCEVQLSGWELATLNFLRQLRSGLYQSLANGGSRNRACFCGSQSKYKHCHGKELQEAKRHIK